MATNMQPYLNGVPFSYLYADLVSYQIGACEYKYGYFMTPASILPIKTDHTIGLRTITLTVDFHSGKLADIQNRIKTFTSIFYEGGTLRLPDGYYYNCFYESSTAPVEKAPWIYQVKYTLKGYRTKEKQVKNVTVSSTGSDYSYTFSAIGELSTPAVITINQVATTSIKICGITISNVTGTVIIDGIKKKVTQNGSNKFADTNLTSFPCIVGGSNTIVSKGISSYKIEYYPLFV